MRILVTGGAGFIGSHLVEHLLAGGHEVRVLDDLSAGSKANLNPTSDDVDLRIGDVREPRDVAGAIHGCDAVAHLAAINSVPRSFVKPAEVHRTNVEGTLTVAREAGRQGVRRVVLASSSSVYGAAAGAERRENRLGRPLSPYAESKRVAETRCAEQSRRFGFEAVALRYFNVYGARQRGGENGAVVARFANAIRAGRPLVIHGGGRQVRDFTHVADVVEATRLALTAPLSASTEINVGTGVGTSVLRLAAILMETAQRWVSLEPAPPREGDVARSVAAVSRARVLLGFTARRSLADGLRTSLEQRSHLGRAAA